ncbi:holo-ACP synthase [Sinimarinibacterium sp. NLF-5-8]|uniref:holo-ACP synthase n=1 Tax=Sinimarinibacterium sp. NLF-5-8 TaxID=2698684 RepID=UPI00137BDAFA|nr:holo-ACP synthase [Sinimarinibacterium sp. NLF-5-8]QHS09824.1 holo-[acyl-carrier-protein] synthase [Sinimarinibacterium sp. NLF-5-8]
MIYGIGVDLLRIDRVEGVLARRGARVLNKLLCQAERDEVAQKNHRARAVTMCFAAKEAFVKALGTGFADGIRYHDVGVVRAPGGRPQLIFSAAMQARLSEKGIVAAHVSLTDDDGMVCAYVVLERAP